MYFMLILRVGRLGLALAHTHNPCVGVGVASLRAIRYLAAPMGRQSKGATHRSLTWRAYGDFRRACALSTAPSRAPITFVLSTNT